MQTQITPDRVKIIIGDQQCQIVLLENQIAQLTSGYNKLVEENKNLQLSLTKGKSKPRIRKPAKVK